MPVVVAVTVDRSQTVQRIVCHLQHPATVHQTVGRPQVAVGHDLAVVQTHHPLQNIQTFALILLSQLSSAVVRYKTNDSVAYGVCKNLQVNFRFCIGISAIYLQRTVLRLALKISVLVSVLWQDRDQDTNFQDWGQGQGTKVQDQDGGSKNLPRGFTSLVWSRFKYDTALSEVV